MKIEDKMKMHEMYVQYWIAMATTGAAKTRDIRQGGSEGRQLTDEEKTKDALDTALRHIHLYLECAETDLRLDS